MRAFGVWRISSRAWALVLLLELAHLVMVRLLLRHLLILFLWIGSLTTLHHRDVYFSSFLFFCFWGLVFWPAILYLHLGCTDIGLCIDDIYGFWIVFVACIYGLCMASVWIVLMDCVYGYVFGLYGYMYGYVFVDGMGTCMDIGS